MTLDNVAADRIHSILTNLEPVLSSRSTIRFDALKSALSELLHVPMDEIYVSTVDHSSNANARTQQMLIRQQVSWKIFVGICLADDLDSTSYNTAARRVYERALEARSLNGFQAMIWMNKVSGVIPGKWSPGLVHLRATSNIIEAIQITWPDVISQTIAVKPLTEETIPQVSGIETANLEQALGWPKEKVEAVVEALTDNTPQVILSGPPGTGKTYAARLLAAELLGTPGDIRNSCIELVQFHPSYGYEDFMEGMRPQVGGDGTLRFENVPGVVVRLTKEIIDSNLPHVLIVDEINRANLSKVFGELMYLLEYRESSVKLMSNEDFNLPSNLYIIGTMNTADRSIRTIDLALRRRFDFFEVVPDVEIIRKHYTKPQNSNELGEVLYDGFKSLNAQLEGFLDRHHLIGHSFFMKQIMDGLALSRVWIQQIQPLIEEYFFDRPDLITDFSLERFWPSAEN